MAHVRKSIRDNVVSTLTGLSITGSNVYASRIYPLAVDKLPGIAVYTKQEESDTITLSGNRTIDRNCTIAVEVYVYGNANYDDQLDAIAVEIEEALSADVTRGGYAKNTVISSFTADYSGDGEYPVGTAVLDVNVRYITVEGDSETGV